MHKGAMKTAYQAHTLPLPLMHRIPSQNHNEVRE